MTKKELLNQLSELPDDAEILVICVASVKSRKDAQYMIRQAAADGWGTDKRTPAELSAIERVQTYEDEGDGSPAFAVINHYMHYLDDVEIEIKMADAAFDRSQQ